MSTPPSWSAEEGLAPGRWEARAGYRFARHDHPFRKVLWCEAGSIVFHLDDGDVALGPGQRWVLAAGTAHAATVGPDGVTCWEAAD